MAQRIVAFYKSQDIAERARDELIDADFDRSDVAIFRGNAGPGLWQEIKEFFGFADEEDRELYAEAARRGDVAVRVSVDDHSPAESRAIEIMRRFQPIDLNREVEHWRASGWTGRSPIASSASAPRPADAPVHQQSINPPPAAASTTRPSPSAASAKTAGKGEQVVPIVEERLNVGKRQVLTGGISLHSYVTQKPVEANVNLHEEHVTVQRRPADRPATAADRAFQERSVEMTETSEQPVVEKQARVVEEVVIGKTAQDRTQTVRNSVKRTDVKVDKMNPDQVQIADQFVSDVSRDPKYRGKDWSSCEADLRRSFQQRHPDGKWDDVKDTIRRGYERTRQSV